MRRTLFHRRGYEGVITEDEPAVRLMTKVAAEHGIGRATVFRTEAEAEEARAPAGPLAASVLPGPGALFVWVRG